MDLSIYFLLISWLCGHFTSFSWKLWRGKCAISRIKSTLENKINKNIKLGQGTICNILNDLLPETPISCQMQRVSNDWTNYQEWRLMKSTYNKFISFWVECGSSVTTPWHPDCLNTWSRWKAWQQPPVCAGQHSSANIDKHFFLDKEILWMQFILKKCKLRFIDNISHKVCFRNQYVL